MSGTYRDVDGYADPELAADWQDRIDAWPTVAAYKRRTHELLAGLRPVLDAGCGTGGDIVSGVGVDVSAVMCRRARGRGAPVARADVARLPFADATFGGVRSDRVVQHVTDPGAVVAELVRVVRPGGRIVLADPDQGSLVIEVPGVPPDLIAEVTARRRERMYRNGTVARRYPAMLAALGVEDVSIEPFALVLTDPDLAFGLPTWVADDAQWDAGMAAARAGSGFVCSVTFFVVSGRVRG